MKRFKAQVVSVLLGAKDHHYRSGDVSSQPVNTIHLDMHGIIGDRHHGKIAFSRSRQKAYVEKGTPIVNLRQITVVSLPELKLIAEHLGVPDVSGADVGANIVLDTPLGFTLFPAGVNGVLRFPSGVILYCMGENEPCDGPGRTLAKRHNRSDLINKFPKMAMHRRGVIAIVGTVGNGVIHTDDPVELFWPAWTGWKPQ